MAKITRKTLKIFANAATNNGKFGSAQDTTKVLSADPTVIQALAAWDNGWLSAVLGARQFPPLEEMQSLQYVHSYMQAYCLQEGIPEYDAGTTYFINSIVKKSGTYELYGSVTDTNLGNALTDATKWVFLSNLSTPTVVRRQAFPSTATYTPNARLIYADIELVGAGGGGGGGNNVANTGGAGGGAGGYSRKLLSAATIGASQSVTIGAAGSGGTFGSPASNGTVGGNSSFGAIFTAGGGTYGLAANATATDPVQGGLGGAAASGDLNVSGGDGFIGLPSTSKAGGNGGNSFYGGGGVAAINGVGGQVGKAYGAGGGGGYAGLAGLAGANGYCLITEYCSA